MQTAFQTIARIGATIAASLLAAAVTAQTVLDSPELYPGEKALYEAAKKEGMVVSFDTGPTWANWAAEFAAFKKRYPEVEIVYNDIGSAATVVALDTARNRPQADTAYYFAGSAFDAVAKNVVAPLKPEYKNTVVYLEPRSTGVGQVVVFAANFGNGGDMNNLQPGFDYFTKLQQSGNVLRVLGTTPYAQFVKGEIPIWISYENDGLKSKYTDGLGDAVAVVIPKEASAAAPYAISLVEKGPNPDAGKLWLNFIMTDMGQGNFAQGFVRPSVPGVKLPDNVADKLPSAPQVRPLDVKTAAAKAGIHFRQGVGAKEIVIPAKAGIHFDFFESNLDSRFRGNDEHATGVSSD